MAFYKNPIIEEPDRCIVCGVTVYDGTLICSVTCQQIFASRGHSSDYDDE